MFQQNKTKILGNGGTPMFLNGMPFYIQKNVIPKRNEAHSSQARMLENNEAVIGRSYKDLVGIDLLLELCEYQEWLIQEQSTQIKELQNQLADYEEELYQKEDKYPTTKNANHTGGIT